MPTKSVQESLLDSMRLKAATFITEGQAHLCLQTDCGVLADHANGSPFLYHGQELLCFLIAESVASNIFRSLAGFTPQAIQPYSRETQAPASGWDKRQKPSQHRAQREVYLITASVWKVKSKEPQCRVNVTGLALCGRCSNAHLSLREPGSLTEKPYPSAEVHASYYKSSWWDGQWGAT